MSNPIINYMSNPMHFINLCYVKSLIRLTNLVSSLQATIFLGCQNFSRIFYLTLMSSHFNGKAIMTHWSLGFKFNSYLCSKVLKILEYFLFPIMQLTEKWPSSLGKNWENDYIHLLWCCQFLPPTQTDITSIIELWA